MRGHDDERVDTEVLLTVTEIEAIADDTAWFFADEDRQLLDDREGEEIDGIVLENAVGFHGLARMMWCWHGQRPAGAATYPARAGL